MSSLSSSLVRVSHDDFFLFWGWCSNPTSTILLGHGGQIEDKSGDEDDGFDEILIPSDYKENGHIVDDEIFEEFVTKVP